MDEGTDRIPSSFRSQVAYVSLVLVLIVTALIVAFWSATAVAAVVGGLGAIWTALALRSGIDVTEHGLRIRGLLSSRHLAWTEIDTCVVTGISGAPRVRLEVGLDYVASGTATVASGTATGGGAGVAVSGEAVAAVPPLLSVVAVVPRSGRLLRVYGTASTPLDPEFPAQAAAELNRALERHTGAASA